MKKPTKKDLGIPVDAGCGNPKYKIENLVKLINDYTDKKIEGKGYPMLKECIMEADLCYKYVLQINQQYKKINDYRLDDAMRRLYDWQEIICEKMLVTGNGSTVGIMFVLKQPRHGWTDKQEVQADLDLNLNVTFK